MHKHAPILLTGFEPFAGDAVHPPWLVAKALHSHTFDGAWAALCKCRCGPLRRPLGLA